MCNSFAVNIPSINVSPLTLNAPFVIDALTLPLTILFNSRPVTPLAGMLYNPEPSPCILEPVATNTEPLTVKIEPLNCKLASPSTNPSVPVAVNK